MMALDCALPARPDARTIDPSPRRGLAIEDFRRIAGAGFGDPLNAYPHSMSWYKGSLYVGTTRSNLCMLRVSKIRTNLSHWPVECPDNLYDLDMRAQIWRYDPVGGWHEVFRSPMIVGTDGTMVPREMGYRCMMVFQAENDDQAALYTTTYASAKGRGTQILRSTDGIHYEPIPKPAAFGELITTLRLLVPFKGRLFTSPTGRAQGNPNAADLTVVFESADPMGAQWRAASVPGFGDPGNISVFEMIPFGDHLYAGTANLRGYQVWRTKAEGEPPYAWEQIVADGAWRGRSNQGVASFCVFRDALYVGSGIQHGGIDIVNKVGPAGPELIRIHPDGTWDLIVGHPRDTPHGPKRPLSGFAPGFNSLFSGYFWRMGAHDGWLYLGTFDWSLMLGYSDREKWPPLLRHTIDSLGTEAIFDHLAGADLYRSHDGESWLPVTNDGFGNPYNYGIRSIVSTPLGLAVGTVNPFAPKVAKKTLKGWHFEDNANGGLEIWLGETSEARRTTRCD